MTSSGGNPNRRGQSDLHGNAPDDSPVVLLLIDVINDLEFPGGDELLASAMKAAGPLATLLKRARDANIPVVYANDNFGRWRSDFKAQLQHCLDEPVRGRELARILRPIDNDYFVVKLKHSAFYSTVLDKLLEHLGARTLILTGIAAESCVLFTAHDAFLREYRIVVPRDCIASQRPEAIERALTQMQEVLRATVLTSEQIDFANMIASETASEP